MSIALSSDERGSPDRINDPGIKHVHILNDMLRSSDKRISSINVQFFENAENGHWEKEKFINALIRDSIFSPSLAAAMG